MQQALDFVEESEVLYSLLEKRSEEDFEMPTQFKNWTVNDVLVHLHFWNRAADMSLNAGNEFEELFGRLKSNMQAGTLRTFENGEIPERGAELLKAWHGFYQDMGARWQNTDPKTRVKWAGPEMSVRSSMSARQMEVWAHGQEIFDLFGEDRAESDRIRNIVVLGVNAFGWSFKVHKMEIPNQMPELELVSPSGRIWNYGEVNVRDCISGQAVEFCQVVTQTRNIADTSLTVTGGIAKTWMENAQCFAGPPETPPAPGTRNKS